VEYGAHLPLIALGYRWLSANDHLVYPWPDGPTALASVIEASGDLTLATTVSLPVVRRLAPWRCSCFQERVAPLIAAA
jgi:hypothetical protein